MERSSTGQLIDQPLLLFTLRCVVWANTFPNRYTTIGWGPRMADHIIRPRASGAAPAKGQLAAYIAYPDGERSALPGQGSFI